MTSSLPASNVATVGSGDDRAMGDVGDIRQQDVLAGLFNRNRYPGHYALGVLDDESPAQHLLPRGKNPND
jgi:hypothetical protein